MEVTQGVRFDTLGLSPETMRALEKRGIELSTPVQAGCIPPMMAWKDVVAKAPTGTGKTFAYGIPIVEHIDPEDETVQAVILAPTRELAIQITEEMRDLAAFRPGVRTVCLYGGAPIGKQTDALKKHPQIVVATPGRLSDHMKRRTVRVDTARTVVLDEADRMLDMGFAPDMYKIANELPEERQTLLFSATIDKAVEDSIGKLLHNPAMIEIAKRGEVADAVDQHIIRIPHTLKPALLTSLLRERGSFRVIVFARTRGRADTCARRLNREGIPAAAIHSDRSQN